MNYLIIGKDFEPFLTNWYGFENNYNEGMTIFNLLASTYSTDGFTWKEIEIDHL